MILQGRKITYPTSAPGRAGGGGARAGGGSARAGSGGARAGASEAARRLDAGLHSALHGETLERLARLRRILPVLGEELATARREAARLRVENRKLAERASKLEHDLAHAIQAARGAARQA